LVLRRAANRKSRLGDHQAALSATAGGMAGSAAFQSIRLKLLRYQNVNAATPGPLPTCRKKASAKNRFGNWETSQVTENLAFARKSLFIEATQEMAVDVCCSVPWRSDHFFGLAAQRERRSRRWETG
jgi:hypothetical protein